MAHTRVIYQNEAVFVGPSPSASGHYKYVSGAWTSGATPTQKLLQLDPLADQTVSTNVVGGKITLGEMRSGLRPNSVNLDRIQSVNYNFGITRKDVNQYGNLAAIDRIILEQPSVQLNFSYIQNGLKNEDEMGLDIRVLKRPAIITFSTNATTGISSVSIVDGGQSYIGTGFVNTLLASTTNGVLSLAVATGGPYAGQVTGVTIATAGVGITSTATGVAIKPSYTHTNIDINTGFSNNNVYTPALTANIADGTTSLLIVTCISGISAGTSDDNNIFVRTVGQGNDVSVANSGTVDQQIIGFGNTVITNYTVEGAVGEFPKVTVDNEAFNMNFITGGCDYLQSTTRYPLPSVDNQGTRINGTFALNDFNDRSNVQNYIAAFRPGGIILDLSAYASSNSLGVDTSLGSINAQKFTISFDLKREPLRKLGSTYYYAKTITFPISYTVSVDALVSELITGNLSNFITVDNSYDLSISYVKPGTETSPFGRLTGIRYLFKGAKLSSQDFSSQIGSNKTVTLKFDGQIGGAQDLTKGMFINGDYFMYAPELI